MAKDNGLVNARWQGCNATLGDGTPLIPGETIVAIPKHEAEQSDNWQPVGGPPKAKDEDQE